MSDRPPPLETPVVLLLYNRAATVRRVVDSIARARPRQLFVVADGPRPDRSDDARRCAEARAVVAAVDWSCEVRRLTADRNLGLKVRIETGLDWVFDQTEVAIILEDDCAPDPTFFPYCDAMLDRHRDDERVMTVSGTRFGPAGEADGASYGYSRYPLIWGWATWRRAWRRYDGAMRDWPQLRDSGWLDSVLDTRVERQYWSYIFERNHAAGASGTWDYAWTYTHWRHDGLAVHPSNNLVSNIGFGPDSTHTANPTHPLANAPTRPLTFPLTHPDAVVRDEAADRAIDAAVFSGALTALLGRARRRLDEGR